jgi:hypothetical protein
MSSSLDGNLSLTIDHGGHKLRVDYRADGGFTFIATSADMQPFVLALRLDESQAFESFVTARSRLAAENARSIAAMPKRMKRSERWRLISLAIAMLALVICIVGAATDSRWLVGGSSALVLVSLLTGEIYRYWVWHQ